MVREMASGAHRTRAGFARLVEWAYAINGDGRYRKWRLEDVLEGLQKPSETVRRTLDRVKIQSELHGDMQSQAEMTWPPLSEGERE